MELSQPRLWKYNFRTRQNWFTHKSLPSSKSFWSFAQNTTVILSSSKHYSDVMMSAMASQITSVSIACSTVCSSADQRKHQSSVSVAFVRGIHWWPVDSPHKGPVIRKMFPFDDVIMAKLQNRLGIFHWHWDARVITSPECQWCNPEEYGQMIQMDPSRIIMLSQENCYSEVSNHNPHGFWNMTSHPSMSEIFCNRR